MEENVKIGKYILRYAVVHLLLLVGISIILGLLEIEPNSGVTIGALMGAAMAVIMKFIQDNKRPPNKSEKNYLVWLSLLVSIAISLLLSSVVLFFSGEVRELFEMLASIGYFVFVFILLFVSVVCFCVLWFSYGYFAKKQYEAMLKYGKL